MLESGCFTFFGRDKYFRPIHIFKPICFGNIPKISDKVKAESAAFASYYVKQHMLVPGKVESFVMIYDLENTPLMQIPVFKLVGLATSI